jgi:hypothetical protein
MPDGQYNDLQLALTKKDFIATVAVSGSWTETGSVETKIGSYTIFDLTSQKLGPAQFFTYLGRTFATCISASAGRFRQRTLQDSPLFVCRQSRRSM